MLHWRLILGTVFTAALGGLCWLDHVIVPRGLILGLFALVLCVAATAEAVTLVRAAGARPSAWAAYGGAIVPVAAITAMPFVELLTGRPGPSSQHFVLPALLLGVVLAAIAAILKFDGSPKCAIDFAATAFVVTYIGGTLAAFAMLRLVDVTSTHDRGLIYLIATVAIVKSGDIGAYTVGRLVGRRKLAPRLSPGKTWEGAVGAIVFACLAAVAVAFLASSENTSSAGSVIKKAESLSAWLLLGLALSIAGMVGDLAESLLKRSAGVKDSSAWMPGFGGVLDVVDSLLLAAPIALGFVLFRLIEI